MWETTLSFSLVKIADVIYLNIFGENSRYDLSGQLKV